MKYLFGPVNSRRLGISLGIDLVPFKTCSLDCLYCECGATTLLTDQIKEYVPTRDVINELDEYLGDKPQLDCITFSGSGEPTLHSGIGAVIDHLKTHYPHYSVVVLTNGTLLWKDEVRSALSGADLVVPSLDAVSEAVFNTLLNPAPGITAAKVIQGIKTFKQHFRGRLNIEIFIVPGINDSESELQLLKNTCLQIEPDLVQLNKLDRPGTDPNIGVAAYELLEEIQDFFVPLNVEIIGKPKESLAFDKHTRDYVAAITDLLLRRPSTLEDLSQMLAINKSELIIILDTLEKEGRIEKSDQVRGTFYKMK